MNLSRPVVSMALMARCCCTLFLAATLAVPASAQRQVSSAEARTAQFVFVVDDSRSMIRTDPNRLAVFAVSSLLGMLDERDEVSVVRLNAPLEGSPAPPIEPLAENRTRMERLLALEGSLAAYGAMKTPCTTTLQAVRRLLEQSYRPGVAQVVFFLTDGECDPADFDRKQARAFLENLPAYDVGQLQFYLLRFRGRAVTDSLVWLAQTTGGEAIEVGTNDPTAILHPFAQALSRSQGYEAYLLTPDAPRLPAHLGAERVRLLAVAPGGGEALDLGARDSQGRAPESMGPVRSAEHQYEDGEVFRYAALDYRPGVAPVTVEVQNADAGWKVVAVPEYRLTLHGVIRAGSCSSPGVEVGFSVDTGTSVCVVAELLNAAGEVVGASLTQGELEATIQVRRPDEPDAEPVELTANRMGDRARFGLPQSNLPRGHFEFQPLVALSLATGEKIHLQGPTIALEVASLEILHEPDALDFETLQPGASDSIDVKFTGTFPPSPGRIELRDRPEIPACVTVQLSATPEGESQMIHEGQPYRLTLQMAPYCGPRSFDRKLDTVLRLVFPEGGLRRLPTVEIPLRVTLDYQIDAPKEIALEVSGGGFADARVPLSGNFQKEVELLAVVAGPEEAELWPDDRDDLTVGFAGRGGEELLPGEDGRPALESHVTAGAGSAGAVTLRARAGGCCPGGLFRTKLGLTASGQGPYAAGVPAPDPLLIPVTVEVTAAGFWACWGPWGLAVLVALLLLLLLLYLANMWRHSRFLDPKRLADKLEPLVWSSYHGAEVRSHARNDVRYMVRKGMPWSHRLKVWLRANPFAFGLPGGSYAESVELFLRPHHDVAASRVSPFQHRDVADDIRRRPEEYRGRLFASAKAGTTFLAVPDLQGRICQMVRNGYGDVPGSAGEEPAPQAIQLRRTELLRPVDEWSQPEPGAPAGWRVG